LLSMLLLRLMKPNWLLLLLLLLRLLLLLLPE
jgi:hypothetical protein